VKPDTTEGTARDSCCAEMYPMKSDLYERARDLKHEPRTDANDRKKPRLFLRR